MNLKDKTTHEDRNNISQKILKRHSNKYMVQTALKFRGYKKFPLVKNKKGLKIQSDIEILIKYKN